MKGDYGIAVAASAAIFAALCVITSAAPLLDQSQQQQQPQQSQLSNAQISNEFSPDAYADYNR